MSPYDALLNAITALDPLNDDFMIYMDGVGYNTCMYCQDNHTEECPVTHLRNTLIEQADQNEPS